MFQAVSNEKITKSMAEKRDDKGSNLSKGEQVGKGSSDCVAKLSRMGMTNINTTQLEPRGACWVMVRSVGLWKDGRASFLP